MFLEENIFTYVKREKELDTNMAGDRGNWKRLVKNNDPVYKDGLISCRRRLPSYQSVTLHSEITSSCVASMRSLSSTSITAERLGR